MMLFSNVFRLVPSVGAKRRPKFFTFIHLNGMANGKALICCFQRHSHVNR